MDFDLWIAFVIASTALLAVPGPTVMLVVSYALGRGRAAGWATIPGTILGDFTAITASLAGAGAVLATSATLFTALKLAGAAYLIWLGVRLWRADIQPGGGADAPARPERDVAAADRWMMFRNAYLVTAFNPKGLVFFVAFVPQFVDPAADALRQFAILEATFLALATVNVMVWTSLAGTLRRRLGQAHVLRGINRLGGGVLIGAGLLTAALRRNS